jgi:hypothetical protein
LTDILIEDVRRACLEKFPYMYQLMHDQQKLVDWRRMSSYGIKDGSDIEVLESVLKNVSKTPGMYPYFLI